MKKKEKILFDITEEIEDCLDGIVANLDQRRRDREIKGRELELELTKIRLENKERITASNAVSKMAIQAMRNQANEELEQRETELQILQEEHKIKQALEQEASKTESLLFMYKSKITQAIGEHDVEKMKTEQQVLAEQLKAQNELMTAYEEYSSNQGWRTYCLKHNEQLEGILPQVQEDFIRAYTKTIEERNGKVKNIEDHLILPHITYDDKGLGKIVSGRLKNVC